MLLEILVTHLERVCGLDQVQAKTSSSDSQIKDKPADLHNDRIKNKFLAKPIEDTNLDEIAQLLKLLQEVMRISSDT